MSSSTALPPLPPRTLHTHPFRLPWGVVLLSLLAFPVSWGLSLTAAMDDSRLVLLAGVVFCSAVVPLAYFAVVRGVPAGRDVYFYVFCVFAFTSMVDLILAFTIEGTTSVLRFYLDEGERYLRTPHGLWINAWDGTFHYACYVLLTGLLLRAGHSYSDALFRSVGLLWSGSILNSMIVLFVGSATGHHAQHIKPSYLLNIPYALFPAIFLYRILQARPQAKGKGADGSVSVRKPLWQWLVDVPLLVLIATSICLSVVRALCVLRSSLPLAVRYASSSGEAHLLDPSAYPTLQMLVYAFYLLPFLAWAALRLGDPTMRPHESDAAFRDWSIFALGAVLQGSFSYVGAALHQGRAYPTEQWLPQSTKNPQAWTVFVAANTLLLLTPLLIVARNYMLARSTAVVQQRVKAQ